MSRRALQAHNPARYEVTVGWDAPMRTYFAQIRDIAIDEDHDDEEDNVVVWIGGNFDECMDPRVIVEAMRPFATVPDDLIPLLEHDRATRNMAVIFG